MSTKPRVRQLLRDGDADKWRVTVSANGKQASGVAMFSNCEMVVNRHRPQDIWSKIGRKVKELQRDLNV